MKIMVVGIVLACTLCASDVFAEKENMATPITTLSEAVVWLKQEAHRIIRASERKMADGTAAFPPQVGIHYEAFWLRDYEYTLEGSVDSYSNKELTDACRLFVKSMDANGAGVDCVKFDGTPIYMPGYGTMGENPVADGSQFTVGVAWHTYQKTKDEVLLKEILDALVKTMNAVPRNPETKLVHIRPGEPQDRCPYGFTDTIGKGGDVLFCSLLYVQACRQLADLLTAGDRAAEATSWREEATKVTESINKVFWDQEIGLYRAATVTCREPDIWGSAFAVFLGVANTDQSRAIATYFKEYYGEIVQHGQIRHLPGGVYWQIELFPRLKQRLKKPGMVLSGGEQQMLAMARALLSNPDILLMDEPSMGLSPALVDQQFDIIEAINKKGTTILMVEQNANMALSIADRGYVLQTGEIVLSGNARDLLTHSGMQQAYLGGEL